MWCLGLQKAGLSPWLPQGLGRAWEQDGPPGGGGGVQCWCQAARYRWGRGPGHTRREQECVWRGFWKKQASLIQGLGLGWAQELGAQGGSPHPGFDQGYQLRGTRRQGVLCSVESLLECGNSKAHGRWRERGAENGVQCLSPPAMAAWRGPSKRCQTVGGMWSAEEGLPPGAPHCLPG